MLEGGRKWDGGGEEVRKGHVVDGYPVGLLMLNK